MIKIIQILFFFSATSLFAQDKSVETKVVIAHEKVEKLPEFPGGINEFRNLIMKNFRSEKLKIERGIVKTTVVFKIDKEGSMTDIKALGSHHFFNEEAVRALSKIKLKWTPAELDNEIVEYRFRMPFTMSFE